MDLKENHHKFTTICSQNKSYIIHAQLYDMKHKTLSVRLPEGLTNELDKLINIEGLFLSNSDVLKYGVRLAILMTKGPKIMDEMKKEAKDNL